MKNFKLKYNTNFDENVDFISLPRFPLSVLGLVI